MADRYPLVVNSSNYRVEEIPSGDNLNLTGSSITGATSVGSTTATISGSQSGTASAPLQVENGGAYFKGPVGVGTELVGKSISNIGIETGGTTSPVVFETKGGIMVRDKNAVGLGSTYSYLWGDAATPRLEFYSDGRYAATVAYRGINSPNIPAGGINQLEIRNIGINSSPINITNGEFPRIRVESDGRIAMGSSIGIATNFYARYSAGYGTTAFSSSSGILQIFSKPDGIGDTDNNSVVLPNGSAWVIPTLGISSVPWFGSGVYSWVFSNKIGPYAFSRAFHGQLYDTNAPDGGPGAGAGLELGATSFNDRGAWLSLAGSNRGDGQSNVIAFSNGPAGSFAERFRISAAGNVGIANSNPTSTLHINGSLAKSSGTFNIEHPVDPTKRLVHSFVEGPRADLIYRGTVVLSAGAATVNIDEEVGLISGTWAALCREPQLFLQNNEDWTQVKGQVSAEGIITIMAKTSTSTATVDWMVVAERHDESIKSTEWTDENGKPILEPDA